MNDFIADGGMYGWINNVKPGHKLRPKPLWNHTERPYRQLHVPTEVLDIKQERGCETGTLFKVRFKGGIEAWLSAAWFCKPGGGYKIC